MEASPRGDRIGSTLDGDADLPYTLEARLGGSGGTEVWVGRAPGGELRAVKLVRDADRAPLATFRHELEAAQALDHPAIVRVHDFGESARGLYVAMDLVQPGLSLATLISRNVARRTPLSSAVVAYIGISVAEALDHAATRAKLDGLSVRLVHRHLSPSNILLDAEGRVRISDLAVPASRVAISPVSGVALRGTPGYVAPEQVRDGVVDARSDVFVLGTILHECATLEPVFARADPNTSMQAVLEHEVRPLAEVLSAFPPILSRVIARAMARDPADRPGDAGELKVALREAVPTTPGYSEARVALASVVSATLRAISQESEARTALIAEDGPHTLQLDATGVEPPRPEAVQRGTLGQVKALAAAELSRDGDSADEPTGALLLPPPGRAAADLVDPAELSPLGRDDGARAAEPRGAAAPAPTTDAGELAPRPPPLVTPRTPTAQLGGAEAPRRTGSLSPRSPTRATAEPARGPLTRLSATLEDPQRRMPLVVGFVGVALVLLVVLVATRDGTSHDDALRELYARGAYAEVEQYYLAHVREFRHTGPAFELAADAWRRERADTLPTPLPRRADERADEAAAPGAGAPVEPRGEGAERRAATTSAAVAGGALALTQVPVPAEIPETAARTKAERKARARAKKSRDTALRALEIDDAVAAEKSLRRCVATFDGPACRLHLGLLHARAGELEEAAIHFERYLEQWPDAPGADQLRAALAALPDVE